MKLHGIVLKLYLAEQVYCLLCMRPLLCISNHLNFSLTVGAKNVHGITDMPVIALSVSIKLYQILQDSAP